MTEKKPLPKDKMLSGLELAMIAVKIENLQSENEQLREAFEEIAYHVNDPLSGEEDYENTLYHFIDIAKNALGY